MFSTHDKKKTGRSVRYFKFDDQNNEWELSQQRTTILSNLKFLWEQKLPETYTHTCSVITSLLEFSTLHERKRTI